MHDSYAPVGVQPAHRERVVQLLSVAFANDRISMDQLDERLAAVYRAQSLGELELLLVDPMNPAGSLAMESTVTRIASPAVVPERGVAAAIMGGFQREGPWIVPRHLKVTAIMGGGELDLREARLGPGVTEIEVFTLWGGVEIIVPDGVRVDIVGMAFMGGFTIRGGSATDDPHAPVLRVSGLAVMGGVDVRRKDRGRQGEKRYKQALDRAKKVRDRDGY
ncbi:MAG TPA: DUF1707 domain-containing protein [Gemmatimonas sp.]|uniref:DUF1707 SHOCT-like domain-containing protein n=1 Tax=Gemmatimonas sp. TaxID=1962908 RepID=UPI002ED7E459